MSEIKNLINNKIVTPNLQTSQTTKSTGIVLKVYEKDNVCDIQYLDAQSRIKKKDKVEVLVRKDTDDWFPQIGAFVEVEVYEDHVYIVGQIINNYDTQVKQKYQLKQDLYADGADSSVGCLVF